MADASGIWPIVRRAGSGQSRLCDQPVSRTSEDPLNPAKGRSVQDVFRCGTCRSRRTKRSFGVVTALTR